MTENSPSAVGRAAIDAYLDSVELALIAADAPRIDRLQVLQDLESQITDMLAGQPSPLTEDSVRAVLDKLEPASHFAATYGNGKQTAPRSPTSKPSRLSRLPRVPWPMIAAATCALLAVACLLTLFAAATNAHDALEFSVFLALATLIFTPISLWIAYRQLRAHPNMPGRDVTLKSICVYTALALALLMLFLAAISEGFILLVLGVAAFFYFESQLSGYKSNSFNWLGSVGSGIG